MKRVLLILLLLFPSFVFAQINKDQIKGYFENGDTPNESHYGALIDFIGQKVDTIQGKGLSSEDFTTAYKNYLDNLPTEIDGKADAAHSHDDRYYTKSKADSIHSQLTSGAAALGVVYIDTDTTIDGWDLQSNTKYIGSNGAVVTVNDEINMGGMVINGDSNIVIQGIIFDLNTNNDTGQGNADPSNFATAITIRDASNIIIEKCTFTNSNRDNADPDWTLHAVEAQNADVLHVVNNKSFGCQFKLDGGTGSLTNVFFDNNFVSECTQMGVSAVVQPAGADVLIRNISITNNTFTSIDNHAVYLGNDNGVGSYTGSVTMENINVTGNHIYGLAYLNSSQNSKGILVNLTKDSRRINISENEIVGASGNTSVQGININTASQDVANDSLGHTITVINNKIHDTGGATGGFSIFLTEVENFQIRNNLISEGKGLRLLNCVDGQVFGNQEGKNVGSMFRFDTSTGIISDKRYTDDAEAIADGLSSGDFYYKVNAGYVAVGGSLGATLSQEEVEDYTGAQFNHNNHTGVTSVYDDVTGEVRLNVPNSASSVSGDSYIDQIWQTPAQYEDTLGFTLGLNTQTSTNYTTVDQLIGQPGFANLADIKAYFDDVPEIQAATAVTDFDRGGTGDAQGVSLDYAVLRQMFENSYNFMFPAQATYVYTYDLPIKEGGVYQGSVNRDDLNATKFLQAAGCNCDGFVSKNIDAANNNWHLSGAIRDISFQGDTVNNTAGSGVWIKNMGENFEIKNIRANDYPFAGLKLTGKVAPWQIYGLSAHENKYGAYIESDSLENSEKEIIFYGPTGDNNTEALIGVNASYTRLTVLNPKVEGNSKFMIEINRGSGTRLLVIGGAWGAYDKYTAANCADCEALVSLNYTYPESGFNNFVIRFMNFGYDDIPHAVIDNVVADTFDINNNEEFLDWTYTRDTEMPIPKGAYHKGVPDYGVLDAFNVTNSLRFHNSRHWRYNGTSTIYLNNYTAWRPGTFQEILMNSSSKPSITISGSVPGPGVLREVGNNFQANVTQLWTITYDGVDTEGDAIYRLTIE